MIPISIADQLRAAAECRMGDTTLDIPTRARATPVETLGLRLNLLQLLDAGALLSMRQICEALPHKTEGAWQHLTMGLVETGHIAKRHGTPDASGTRVRFTLTPAGRELRAELVRRLATSATNPDTRPTPRPTIPKARRCATHTEN